MALQGKEIRTVDDEVISIVENNLKRTSFRYDKIYRSLEPWEHNVYCLVYKFHGIFKEIANNIIANFEHKEMNFVEEMIENGKIESGFYRFSQKDESDEAIAGIHLNDESKKIIEEQRTTGAIESTCTSLLGHFFETGSEKVCQSILFFFNVRRLLNPVLLREFIALAERCRDKFANFLILSYLARETPSLIKYWKELTLQKANTSNEWLFGEAVINFGIAIAQSSGNKSDNKAFSNIINLVSNEDILNNMGIRFGELHILNYALFAFDKAIKLNPKNVMSWKRKGDALLELNKTKEAIKAFDEAIKIDPENAYPWSRKGLALLKLNKTKEAIKVFDEAIKVFDEAIKINPNDATLWEEKGITLFELNKTKEAIKAFDEAIKIDPENAYPWSRKGLALLKLNKTKEAIKAFDEAIKINPANTYIWSGKGLALLGLNKTKEAIRVFDEAIKINPANATLWKEKGHALLELNKTKEAIKAFDEAIKINPNDVYSWSGKGLALLCLGKKNESVKVFDEGIKFCPKAAALWSGKGHALLELNKTKEGVKAFDKAIKLDPNDATPWNKKRKNILENQ